MIEAMWNILLELAPWLLIGVLVAGALHALLPADFMRRHLSGRWSVLKAAAIGVPLPLCSCAVIPVGLSLKKQGASSGASVAFLISTPQTGVDSIMVSAGMLGVPFAIFKMVSAFVIGLVGGGLTDALAPKNSSLNVLPAECHVSAISRWRSMLAHSLMLLRTIWRWLAIGVVASAAITYFLPADALARLGAAGGGVWAMLLALVIGMPLYVCAVASVPIAAALVHSGFPVGAALVFLIAGPASNLATMGAVYHELGRQAFVIYMLTIAIGSLLCGYLFQSVIDVSAVHATMHSHEHHDLSSPWAVGSALFMLALMIWFAAQELVGSLRRRSNPASAAAQPSVEVAVDGMTCQSCVARLEKTLSSEEGVSDVAVTLKPGRAIVYGAVSDTRVRELIKGAGFQPV